MQKRPSFQRRLRVFVGPLLPRSPWKSPDKQQGCMFLVHFEMLKLRGNQIARDLERNGLVQVEPSMALIRHGRGAGPLSRADLGVGCCTAHALARGAGGAPGDRRYSGKAHFFFAVFSPQNSLTEKIGRVLIQPPFGARTSCPASIWTARSYTQHLCTTSSRGRSLSIYVRARCPWAFVFLWDHVQCLLFHCRFYLFESCPLFLSSSS